MLPASIVERLRAGDMLISNQHKSVSVLFSKICHFDSYTSKLAPADVVKLLNNLFSCFDSITDDVEVYKVETIGDCYLVDTRSTRSI